MTTTRPRPRKRKPTKFVSLLSGKPVGLSKPSFWSARAKRLAAEARLEVRLTRFAAQWRKEAVAKGRRPMPNAFCDSWTLGVRAGKQHALNRCADQLQAALTGARRTKPHAR